MISFLVGRIEKKERQRLLINVAGFGFSVITPDYPIDELPDVGESIKLYTRIYFGRKDIRIYGFVNEREAEVFDRIVEIPKVGPQIALSLISHLGVDGLMRVIREGDFVTLGDVPRVGIKSAKRIISELKDEIDLMSDEKIKSVVEALVRLGYTRNEIKSVMGVIFENSNLPIEDLLKKVLSKLG